MQIFQLKDFTFRADTRYFSKGTFMLAGWKVLWPDVDDRLYVKVWEAIFDTRFVNFPTATIFRLFNMRVILSDKMCFGVFIKYMCKALFAKLSSSRTTHNNFTLYVNNIVGWCSWCVPKLNIFFIWNLNIFFIIFLLLNETLTLKIIIRN